MNNAELIKKMNGLVNKAFFWGVLFGLLIAYSYWRLTL